MNKIFNWTIGSFFRTLGRIFGYLIIGILFGLIVAKSGFKLPHFLSISHVNAATLSSSSDYLPLFCNQNNYCDDSIGGADVNPGYRAMGTSYDNTTRAFLHQIRFRTTLTSANYLQNETTYTIRYTINFNPKYLNKYYDSDDWQYVFSIQNTSNSWSDVNKNNYSVSVSNITNNNYSFYIYVRYTATTQIKAFNFRFYIPAYMITTDSGIYPFRLTSVNFVGLRIEYAKGTQDAVENQTTTIINQTNEINNNISDVNNSINDVNDSINNSDVSDSTSEAGDFFSGFTTNTHGLTGIITAPLNAINSLTSKTCSPLVLPIPFVEKSLTLPCMRQIYVDNFGDFMNIYDVIVIGIISYWVLVRIFALVKDFKNPEHDEIEVMDL